MIFWLLLHTAINTGVIQQNYMPSMKCVSCGIGFFSPSGSDKCSRCMEKDSHGMEHGDHSCGCGHSH